MSVESGPSQDPVIYDEIGNYVQDKTSNPALKAYFSNAYTGRVELTSSILKVYKPGSTQYLETITRYEYNSYNYQVNNVSVKQSNGDETVKHITYSSDYNGGMLGVLNQNNMVSIPVSTTEAILKYSTTPYPPLQYLGEKVTEFMMLQNGDIKPSRTREQRMNQPGSLIVYDGPDDPGNSSKYKDVQSFIYDNSGNLAGMKDEGSHVVSNIYGYNDKYVVASVINADPELDKAAYTSFETPDWIGWTVNGSGSAADGNSVTGTKYFNLSSGTLSAAIYNTDKGYKLSFWSTSTMNVNGNASLVKSGPVINGYTYYEYAVAQGSSGVAISGSANIDELRLYPQSARMRTVSYDPLIGKTSECDENNRTSYFEYDALGRLRFLKDESRNIVKMYEYNYASKRPSNCNTVYYNHTIKELFVPNSCAPGYVSVPVFFIVDAGSYESIISQADADEKAEAYINANGQHYANIHKVCIQVYSNEQVSEAFTKQGCAIGSVGTTITYTVPAGRYTSTVSMADANQMAQEEINANGQAFANKAGNASCVVDYTPVWRGTGTPQFQCQTDASGNMTGHQLVLVTDINPNSSSNPRTQWQDIGFNTTACPIQAPIYAKLTYENVYNTPYGTVADIVVRFYLNGNLNQPVTVSNLTLEYNDVTNCSNSSPASYITTTTVSGSAVVILHGVSTAYTDYGNTQGGSPGYCNRNFTLRPRSGYLIAQ